MDWIPVEVLPPMRCIKHEGITIPRSSMSEIVLVYTNYKQTYVGFYSFNGNRWEFNEHPGEDEIVTHWMHLPDPPQSKL